MSNMVKIKHHHSSQEKPYYTFRLITKEVGQLPSKPIAMMNNETKLNTWVILHTAVYYRERI